MRTAARTRIADGMERGVKSTFNALNVEWTTIGEIADFALGHKSARVRPASRPSKSQSVLFIAFVLKSFGQCRTLLRMGHVYA